MLLSQLLDKIRALAQKKHLPFDCQTSGEPDGHDYLATLHGIEISRENDNPRFFRVYSTTRLFKTFCVKPDSVIDFFDGYFDALAKFDYTRPMFYRKGFEVSAGLLFQKNIELHALN